jgi:hypothetical protein
MIIQNGRSLHSLPSLTCVNGGARGETLRSRDRMFPATRRLSWWLRQDRIQFFSQRRRDPAARSEVTRTKHADVAQLVEHHLAKVRVAGSNPVVRSVARLRVSSNPREAALKPSTKLAPTAEWPSGLGKGLQSPVHGFDSRLRLCMFCELRSPFPLTPPSPSGGRPRTPEPCTSGELRSPYVGVCHVCRLDAWSPSAETLHYVELPHALCVFYFHVAQSLRDMPVKCPDYPAAG